MPDDKKKYIKILPTTTTLIKPLLICNVGNCKICIQKYCLDF